MTTQPPRQSTHKYTHNHSFAHKTTHTNVRAGKERKRGQVDTGETQPLCVTPDTPLPWRRDGEKKVSVAHTPMFVSNINTSSFRQLAESHGLQESANSTTVIQTGREGDKGGRNYFIRQKETIRGK